MKKTIEVPEVMQCQAAQCVYNVESMCRARAITVGDMQQHECDTMMKSNSHTSRMDTAGVGACRSTNCVHNDDWECQADGIEVTLSGDQTQCATFAAK
jgi:hypothetical protein